MLISRLDRVIHAIRLAMAFLTIIPVRWSDGRVTETDLSESRYAYPVIGGAIGLVLAVLSETIRLRGIDPTLAAFLLIAAEVAITGGLHLDGLADTSDGLFLWGDASRRLAVTARSPRWQLRRLGDRLGAPGEIRGPEPHDRTGTVAGRSRRGDGRPDPDPRRGRHGALRSARGDRPHPDRCDHPARCSRGCPRHPRSRRGAGRSHRTGRQRRGADPRLVPHATWRHTSWEASRAIFWEP